MAHSVVLRAPAKVNLHLGIYPGRDERGYHRADSIMVALDVADEVRVSELDNAADGDAPAADVFPRLTLSEDVGVPASRNTAWVAARRLCETFGRSPRYAVRLTKRIPPRSGLGGSSSDAAGTILGLCRLWGMSPAQAAGDARVVRVARSVGADVPFFLRPDPTLLVGRGDVPARSFPSLAGVPVVLLRPSCGVGTPEAYRAYDEAPSTPQDPGPLEEALERGDVVRVAASLHNNLAPAAERLVPACGEALSWLRAQRGVMGAQLTGSGSCAFAIVDGTPAARRVVRAARVWRPGWWAISCETVGSGTQFC
ncbi:4-(cytidine 5'-diphospho)-2-C-methyl-D-erythritol kinase [Olsenella sp. HMSC062G07]|uniref:4-(cytidine 5'-diphospho)-2-C-methyl-D-erythritol kinase n=1 Tax=Olsenella sp. HMSC062G07 TaxID=1739330 RepID=UPI0008A1D9D1|nr:hypothetical protein [Olsenella sp. HMSC062G07]OFK22156.1 hypothetical protein HMPREF2826_02765 [Olsenella sp. HMSC062G07]